MAHHPTLDFARRRHVYQLISARPGIHLRLISRELDIGVGVLRHHLRTLRRAGLIRSRRSGSRRLFFAGGYHGTAGRSRQELLLDEIHRTRGITPAELAARWGISRMLVNYHLQRLRSNGQVRVQRAGRTARLFVASPGHASGRPASRHTRG